MNRITSAFLFVALGLGSLGAVAQEQKAAAQAPAISGRYIIVFSPHARADTFLLDTQTGRTWQLTKYTDLVDQPVVWQYLTKVDSEGELMKWLSLQRMNMNKSGN